MRPSEAVLCYALVCCLAAADSVQRTAITTIDVRKGKSAKELLENSTAEDWALLNRARASGNHSVTLHSYTDAFWRGDVSLGTPEQIFTVLFDTGSFDVWVADDACPAGDHACGLGQRFDSSKSSTYKKAGGHFRLCYGAGCVSGNVKGNDTLNVGGIKAPHLTFGQVSTTSIPVTHFSGIIGMGAKTYDSKTEVTIPTWFGQLMEAGVKQFAFLSPPEDGVAGKLDLGGPNPDHYTGEFTDLALNLVPAPGSYPFYQVFYTGIQASGQSLWSGNIKTMVDSGGGPILGIPSDAYDKYLNLVGGSSAFGGASAPCKKLVDLELSFTAAAGAQATSTVTLSKEVFSTAMKSDPSTCRLALTPGPYIADVFLRQFYTVFDVEHKRIRLAKPKQLQ